MVSIAAARKTVSVLFCDLAESTMLGERLDPEPLREVLGSWYEEMRIASRTRLERSCGNTDSPERFADSDLERLAMHCPFFSPGSLLNQLANLHSQAALGHLQEIEIRLAGSMFEKGRSPAAELNDL